MCPKQVFNTLQKEYKKSNTLRKESILKKYGFKKNEEEQYLNFLNYELKKIELKKSILELSKENLLNK